MSVVIDSDNNNIDIVQEPINVTISTGGADVSAVWGNISGDLTDQEDLQAILDDKVPYTGATQDVNLGEFGAQVGNLEFDTTPTNTPTGAGSVYWSDTDGTLNLVLKGGQTISRIGETQHIRALNNTGTQIARGKVVYVVGAQGQRLTIALADADTELLSKDTIGFTSEAIADGAEGFVIVQGVINNVSTTGMTDGATVYLSQTAGGYTTTPPPDPAHLVILGFIVNGGSGGAGSIYVKVDNGYELEELHNISDSEKATAVDADAVLLRDSADNNLWKRLTWANVKSTLKTYFDTLYQGTLTFDSTPTNGSTNPVTSDGVFDALALKQNSVTLTTTGTSGAATLVGATLNIPQYQAALTNPVTGTGVAGQVSYWSGTGTQTGSADFTWNDTTKILSFSNGGTLINEIRVGSINTNTIIGRLAGSSASLTGDNNSFFGVNAGRNNTTGVNNSFFGLSAGQNNTTGGQNSFFGVSAGLGNTTGVDNSFFGLGAGQNKTTGGNNSFFGRNAGRYIANGSNLTVANNSVFLGFDTRAAADNETNQTVIGYQAIGLGSNTTVIGNSSTTLTWLGGSTSIGTTTSSARLHVRGSGTTSATTALLVQNSGSTELLTVRDDNRVIAHGGIFTGGANTVAGILPQGTINQENILIRSSVFPTTGSITDITLTNGQGDPAHTSGTRNLVNINRNFSPTSGSGIYNLLLITSTINQTGGANGITRGLYLNPTLTAAADWRSVEFSNNTGWGLYGAGTANNYLGGKLAIGVTNIAYQSLLINRPITGATTAGSFEIAGNVQSDVTNIAIGYNSSIGVQNASFTLSSLRHILIQQGTFGGSAIVSNQSAFHVNSTLTGATNNYGFYGDIASGTGRWNLYMNGTAANYLAGNTSIGTTTSSGRLTVQGSGTTSSTKALVVNNSTPTAIFEILDNGRINQTIPGGSTNTLFGTDAGANASLANNNHTAFGRQALFSTTTAANCTAIGREAAYNGDIGDTTAVGYRALYANISGFGNTAIGTAALASVTSGNNVGVGRNAGSSLTASTNNLILGYNAGRFIIDGVTALTVANNSVFLGFDTRAAADSQSNQIVIGYQAIGNGSNTATLGNTSITNTYLRGNINYTEGGNFVIGTTTGTKIGTATSQKIGLWNATPIVQPTTGVAAATRVGGGGTTVTDTDTFDGYTIAQLVKALRNMGALA